MRAVVLVVIATSPAFAGPTDYGWLPETETTQGVELGTSIYERDNLGPVHERTTALEWTPAIALTHCLELAIPVEVATITQDDAAPFGGVSRYGAELRYRFLRSVPGLRPIARFALSRDVAVQSRVRTELELAASYDLDRVQVEGDLGLLVDLNFAHVHRELHPGFGVSVRVTDELRLGAEIHGEISHDATATSWGVIGPDLAWRRGRFWLAGVVGIGIHAIVAAPRVNLGVDW
jgi:hypothetical protein